MCVRVCARACMYDGKFIDCDNTWFSSYCFLFKLSSLENLSTYQKLVEKGDLETKEIT